jgi:tripartite-type tricarboxylate transporter receptor subunit TctC
MYKQPLPRAAAWRAGVSSALIVVATTACAIAQEYPARPIRALVGQSAGGATDIVARGLGQKLTDAFGQTIVVDNRGGAAGSIAAALVAKAAPDGYTILIVPGSYAINPSLYRDLQFDPLKDLAAVTLIATGPYVLMVHPSLPAKSARELIALAKAKPKELVYGSGGFGSSGHLAAELFSNLASVQMNHVPYKGAGPALVDLLGGQLQVVFGSVVSSLPYNRSGRLRALAVTSGQRIAMVPELPTIAESGLPGYEFNSWFGMLAPGATPRAIVTKLQTATATALRTPDLRERFTREGSEPVGSTPEQFAAYLQTEIARWEKVIKGGGMKVE